MSGAFRQTSSNLEDHYCGDPFNHTHPELTVVSCQDFCAKWVVRLDSGAMQTVRTCSSQMQLNMRIFTVCMRESGSSDGHVCFCEGDLCNASTSLTDMASSVARAILFLLMTSAVVCCKGFS
ncbi:hypothetical protein C0Q70_02585 [Pomacea canaliculata]|uniref:Protein quiver n=1 Tax=Pomacea canaliculata TaxID=400727 RepID=A0A2T7PQC0_POMCA|nr:hypothetical protein C0Q70_02585 [Pomacea canaliculata]